MKKIIITVFVIIMFMPCLEAKTYSKTTCKKYAYTQVLKKGWTIKDYKNLVKLWNYESGWNARAYNPNSGACGIPQAKPCYKLREYGSDYRTNCKVQINWGLNYIKKRYKTPTKAYSHVKKTGWY